MSSYGKQIMQAVTLILEGEHSVEVKEQVSGASFSPTNILDVDCKPELRVTLQLCFFPFLLDSVYPCQHSRWQHGQRTPHVQ